MRREKIIILDFGSQYTQLIARKIRESRVYAEIYPYDVSEEKLRSLDPKGIVLSGGPSSVYADGAPKPSFDVFNFGVPVLGVCYGLQLLAYYKNGKVDKAAKREYGPAKIDILDDSDLFEGAQNASTVWMSHGDALIEPPEGFEIIARTENAPICAVRSKDRKIFGVQFHPEVRHTEEGEKILRNFARKICSCSQEWTPASFIEEQTKIIREKVGDEKVLLALSGGVDSTVAAVLLHNILGDNLICAHIDSGLMRKNESQKIMKLLNERFDIRVDFIDASKEFLTRLKGVSDPEKKRKIIGATFIEIFEEKAKKFENVKWLAQGTLYPDVIESLSVKGPSATIKSHHNVGGLPEKMNLKLLEPFRELFKDEVRAVGRSLGVPEEFVGRHPFPGPGLAIRILGEITPEKLETLREADEIYIEEIKKAGLYGEIWQAFAVLLPVKTVGVMGDERTYEFVCALRAVVSSDGMTADWKRLPYDLLAKVSSRIINEVRGINRVVYDVTSKPPGTIEWE